MEDKHNINKRLISSYLKTIYGWRMDIWLSLSSLSLDSLYPDCFSSVSQSCLTPCDPTDCSQASLSSLSPKVCSNSCLLSQWCHPTTSSSVAPFFSCPQSFQASGSFLMSQVFTSGGQSIGVSASASVLPMNIQGWFPLGVTDVISLLSKGLSRVISNTTVQKHQFFSPQPLL